MMTPGLSDFSGEKVSFADRGQLLPLLPAPGPHPRLSPLRRARGQQLAGAELRVEWGPPSDQAAQLLPDPADLISCTSS